MLLYFCREVANAFSLFLAGGGRMAGPQPANPRPVDLLQLEDVNNPKGVGGEEAKTEEETKTVVCQLALRFA